ncbi:MAG TPA: UbiH/UbiF/VisC/COQ6 family ubiquinone biosynthesis hydroxylase [Gammaproteobacteria bacterium]|nr:UbiH/UbiF/VisC/COQ6 family ubiquinone biosynthesis hydroxylase [Gammaproteobacteria bacterium]
MAGDRFDVIVVGGGCVGATLACALGQAGLGTAVVELHPPLADWPAGSVDLRVFSITPASRRAFTAVDAWPAMVARGVSPFREMHVWDAAGAGVIHFDSTEAGEDCLGHIVEERVIRLALAERMAALPTVEVICPARLAALESGPDGAVVTLEDGRRLQAPLVVGADGARSRVRDLAGIGAHVHDYRQRAVVAVVETELWHQETAWQRFLPTGPLAFLPLRDGRSSIVWSMDSDRAEVVEAADEGDFQRELGEAFEYALGRITGTGPRAGFPLRRLHAESYIGDRVALIGDAGHTIHPLAGQGANLGFMDAAALAQVVTEARSAGRDPGARRVLRRYERWRKGDNLAMMGAMDVFKHLFASRLPPLRWGRNLGLALVDRATPIKALFMDHAMGLAGDLPALARPDPDREG